MSCYIITYDLMRPGKDYSSLIQAIKSYGTWGKITESCWAIVSTSSASAIRDFLSQHIDINDRLFVIKSGGEAAWRNAIASTDWLKRNL
jgi:hypothetical protein